MPTDNEKKLMWYCRQVIKCLTFSWFIWEWYKYMWGQVHGHILRLVADLSFHHLSLVASVWRRWCYQSPVCCQVRESCYVVSLDSFLLGTLLASRTMTLHRSLYAYQVRGQLWTGRSWHSLWTQLGWVWSYLNCILF